MRLRGKKTAVLVTLLTGLSVLVFLNWARESKPGFNIEHGYLAVEKAYLNQQSGKIVEVSGRVVRILLGQHDDPGLQKFVLQMRNGQNILVTHNIFLSEEVPIATGDEVMVRGEYTWTEPGGAVNWTNRDHTAAQRHGWIEHQGIKYD